MSKEKEPLKVICRKGTPILEGAYAIQEVDFDGNPLTYPLFTSWLSNDGIGSIGFTVAEVVVARRTEVGHQQSDESDLDVSQSQFISMKLEPRDGFLFGRIGERQPFDGAHLEVHCSDTYENSCSLSTYEEREAEYPHPASPPRCYFSLSLGKQAFTSLCEQLQFGPSLEIYFSAKHPALLRDPDPFGGSIPTVVKVMPSGIEIEMEDKNEAINVLTERDAFVTGYLDVNSKIFGSPKNGQDELNLQRNIERQNEEPNSPISGIEVLVNQNIAILRQLKIVSWVMMIGIFLLLVSK